MRMTGPAQRWTSLLLLLAFLHGVLAPAMSMAAGKDASVRTALVQLCGPSGHQSVEIELSGADGSDSDGVSSGHSGFCLLCFHSATPPPFSLAVFLPLDVDAAPMLSHDGQQPRFVSVWDPVRARAPPAGA